MKVSIIVAIAVIIRYYGATATSDLERAGHLIPKGVSE